MALMLAMMMATMMDDSDDDGVDCDDDAYDDDYDGYDDYDVDEVGPHEEQVWKYRRPQAARIMLLSRAFNEALYTFVMWLLYVFL